MENLTIISAIVENKYLQILAEGDAFCVNEIITYDDQNYRVLRCHSFVHDASKFKAICLLETTKEQRSYNN
jgi:hypothetical protein